MAPQLLMLVGTGCRQLLSNESLASPGVMQRGLKSTLFWSVSTPSG